MKMTPKILIYSIVFMFLGVLVMVTHSCMKELKPVVPVVITTPVSDISQSFALSGGTITSDGGAEITAKGVCWGIASNPTISESKTIDGTGTGNFVSTLTGLLPGSTYHVRAYATNSLGTSYGDDITFNVAALPSLTTTAISSISPTTATGGGNITNDGGGFVTRRGICWSTTSDPTIFLTTSTIDGTGTGLYISSIVGLTANTTYYVKAWAENGSGISYGNVVSFTTPLNGPTGSVTDIEGNVYHTVTIGTQVWMAENLKTTKYNDGTVIPNVTAEAAWSALTTGAYCDYANLPINSTTYGRLYNWYVAGSTNPKNVCPTSWHVPSNSEWSILFTYLGGGQIASNKLRETGLAHWITYGNNGATNETGFTALPGGERSGNGPFYYVEMIGNWWSSTQFDATEAWLRFLFSSPLNPNSQYGGKYNGFSVRCLRDL